MNNSLKIITNKWGVSSKLEYIMGAPPVNNDIKKTEQIKKYIDEIVEKKQFVNIERSMAGEDFGHYQAKIPGVFMRVGVGNNKLNPPLHNSKFDIDEDSIPFAVNMMSYLMVRYFNDMNNLN